MIIIGVDNTTSLRELNESDAGALFSVINHNRIHLREWLPWVDMTKSQSDSLAFIRESVASNLNGKALILSVWSNNSLVGIVSLVSIRTNEKEAMLGYWLSYAAQGKGLAYKCCLALIDYAFKKIGLIRITARCVERNSRSFLLMGRLGLYVTGLFPVSQWARGAKQATNMIFTSLPLERWLKLRAQSRESSRLNSESDNGQNERDIMEDSGSKNGGVPSFFSWPENAVESCLGETNGQQSNLLCFARDIKKVGFFSEKSIQKNLEINEAVEALVLGVIGGYTKFR